MGKAGTLFFFIAGPLYGPVLTDHLLSCGVVTNDWTGAHNLFHLYALLFCDHCPPAQGNVEDFDFVSAVLHSNHHAVGTASWQNHDNSHPPSVIILQCNVCLCL